MTTRREFLSDMSHRIRFVYLPKHSSWLNQIECWFSILTRQLLARGSFTPTDDLAAKIDAYVAWYLQTDRPFRWSYRPKSWAESRKIPSLSAKKAATVSE